MTASQTGVYPGAAPYPPPPAPPRPAPPRPAPPGPAPPASPASPSAEQPQPEAPTKQEVLRQHLATGALLFLLTAITLGVAFSSFAVFMDTLRVFLVVYTGGAWIAWIRALRR